MSVDKSACFHWLRRYGDTTFPRSTTTGQPCRCFWDETDFISYLEVLPEVDEERYSYLFRVQKDGVRLELDVWDYNNVSIWLYRDGVECPLLELKMIPCSGTRYVNDQRGEYLEFAPSRVFEDQFYPDTLIPVGVRLSVKPSIQIQFFSV